MRHVNGLSKIKARIWRVLRSSAASFAQPEDTWAQSLLSSAEYTVYARMDPRDREHATRVARRLLELHPQANALTLRAALLHDCGKQVRPYRLLERIWVGLFAPRQISRAVQDSRLGAFKVRALHPSIGAKLILQAGGDPHVAELVAQHHTPHNQETRMLHEVDELE